MNEQGIADLEDRRIAGRPLAQFARRPPGEPMLDPAERVLGHPLGRIWSGVSFGFLAW